MESRNDFAPTDVEMRAVSFTDSHRTVVEHYLFVEVPPLFMRPVIPNLGNVLRPT